jgi:galactitol-specific phosphotransferase system IIB component
LKAEGMTEHKVVPWDLGSFKGQKADIVVAPTDMASHLKDATSRVVLIKNLVDKEEIKEKIITALNELSE